MNIKKRTAILIYFIIGICFTNAQTITLKGAVKDSLQNDLAYANVIAKPVDISKNLQFSITDDDGLYKLELTKNDAYIISADNPILTNLKFIKMKKLILGMVFVFASITMVNANSNVKLIGQNIDCIGLAFSVDIEQGGISYSTFKSIVDNCERMQE